MYFYGVNTTFDVDVHCFDVSFKGEYVETSKRYKMTVHIIVDDTFSLDCGTVIVTKNLLHFIESFALHCLLIKILRFEYDDNFSEFWTKLYLIFEQLQRSIDWLE